MRKSLSLISGCRTRCVDLPQITHPNNESACPFVFGLKSSNSIATNPSEGLEYGAAPETRVKPNKGT